MEYNEYVMSILEMLMGLSLVFAIYITQADRKYFCKNQIEKIKSIIKK